MNTVEVAALLLWERVPLAYDTHQSGAECRKLAKEFVAERELPEAVDPDDLDEVCRDVVAWARGRGYHLWDEPPSPYSNPRSVDAGEWVPKS